MYRVVVILLLIFSPFTVMGQGGALVNPVFYMYDSLPVKSAAALKMPFTGGFNSPQFTRLDLNNDGVSDLVVFDKNDNKALTFINQSGEFVYAPAFESILPTAFYWFKTADLNTDGKPDVFTLTETGNLIIHLNQTGTSDKFIRFKNLGEQYYRNQYLESSGYPLYNVLGLSKTDLPEISDLDNDGDVDIVFYDPYNFSYSQFRDVRTEKGWPKDTWEFQNMDICFGYFNEGFDNSFVLGECAYRDKLRPRHVGGSSLLMFDNDEDNDFEMLVSNVGFKKMTFLRNGRSQNGSYYDTMVFVDSIFPRNTTRAADFVFPAAYYVDADNDGVKDLLVAPNGFSDVRETSNIWLYRNHGKNNKPDFRFVKNNFLTEHTLDHGARSAPAFCDYDADGDLDMFVAANGDFEVTGGMKDRIYLYKNTGTATRPSFELVDSDFAGLSARGIGDLIIRFGDVDGDKDIDLYFGNLNGKVGWYSNSAGAGKPLNLSFASADLLGNTVMPGMANSAPVLYNYNNDTLPDMLVGMYNGRVALYVNTGTTGAPQYTQASTRAWGMRANEWRTDVSPKGFISFGYAVPEVADIDRDGADDIIIGTSFGTPRLYHPAGRSVFDSLSAVNNWLFRRVFADSAVPDMGSRITVAAADLNRDSLPELFFGNARGGLYMAKLPTTQLLRRYAVNLPESPVLYPNPASSIVHITRKRATEDWNISLTDAAGRTVRTARMMPGESSFGLDVTGVVAGYYIVQVNNGGGRSSAPLIISR